MKKVILWIGLVAVMAAAFFLKKKENIAKSADFSVSVKDQTVKKGEEFTLYVTIDSSVNISKLEAYLDYEDSYLEYISADSANVVGASGMLSILQSFDEPVNEVQYAITMRALEVGSTDVLIQNIYIEDDENSDIIEINKTSATVRIEENSSVESDATLSELLVFPGTLDVDFDPAVTNYEVTVEKEVEELILSAIPSSADSTVVIDSPEVLAYGKNEVKILVTAPSGSINEYKITVYRLSE